MDINQILIQLLTGLQLGAIYALVALGLTLIFGTLGVVNFAHGSLYMVGVYLCWVLATQVGWWSAIILVPLVLFVLGVILERGLIRFFYERSITDQILVTFGLAIVIQESVRWYFGGETHAFPPPDWGLIPINIGIGFYPPWRLLIVLVTTFVVLALYALLRYTKFGLVVRAGMRDREMVSFLGVNLPVRFMLVFGFGTLLAGIAGIMGGPTGAINPDMGAAILVPSFLVVVVGGMGSFIGAIVAGILFGEAQAITALFYPDMSYVVIYIVAGVVISLLPRGLFGTRGVFE